MIKKTLYTILAILILLFTIFVDLSIYFRAENSILSALGISIFLSSSIFLIYTFITKRLILVASVIYLIFTLIWIFWYDSIKPSNDRIWQKDVALLSYATIDNNLITVHNIRNFTYTTEYDYKASYYDETFDINKLNAINFIATYWMGDAIAHTFLSFSFSDNKHLAISIEARKEVGESYSIIKGFFKENELYYVVADERDLIGLRTNIRKNPPEKVYMYQINADIEDEKKVFLNYMKKINELKNKAEFYNTLTTNCTTSIWDNSLINYSNMRFNWQILISGHTAEYLYKNNLLKTYGLSFKELKKRAYINPLIKNQPIDSSYSFKIREKQ
jgi:hypothetical protein